MAARGARRDSGGMDLEKRENYACAKPAGIMPSQAAARLVVEAVAAASAQGVPRLLVDLRGVKVTSRSAVMERYELGHEIARAAHRVSRVALVMPPEAIAEHEFTFIVASNRGPHTAGFAGKGEALSWLLAA
jgi:hypothetical protein